MGAFPGRSFGVTGEEEFEDTREWRGEAVPAFQQEHA